MGDFFYCLTEPKQFKSNKEVELCTKQLDDDFDLNIEFGMKFTYLSRLYSSKTLTIVLLM